MMIMLIFPTKKPVYCKFYSVRYFLEPALPSAYHCAASLFLFPRFKNDRQEFIRRATLAVNESLERLYDIQGECSPLVFTEPKPAHEEIIQGILLRHRNNDLPHEDTENVDKNIEDHHNSTEMSIDSVDISR